MVRLVGVVNCRAARRGAAGLGEAIRVLDKVEEEQEEEERERATSVLEEEEGLDRGMTLPLGDWFVLLCARADFCSLRRVRRWMDG